MRKFDTHNYFSKEEEEFLLKHYNSPMTMAEIAERLGRSEKSIICRERQTENIQAVRPRVRVRGMREKSKDGRQERPADEVLLC